MTDHERAELNALAEVHRQQLYVAASPRGGRLHWTVCRNPGAGYARGHGGSVAAALAELQAAEQAADTEE